MLIGIYIFMWRKFIRLLLIATLLAPPLSSLSHTARPRVSALVKKIYPNTVTDAIRRITPAVVAISIEGEGVSDGGGTGSIIDPNGIVLTAWHVVHSAVHIEVVLYNGLRLTAKTVAHNEESDLALLQIQNIDGLSLPYLLLGNADTLRKGQQVVSLGNDRNLGHDGNLSATSGVVSAMNRQVRLPDGTSFSSFETDLRVQEGCSGGPVCDLDGAIVGVQIAVGFNYVKSYATPITDAIRISLLNLCEEIKAAAKPEAKSLGSTDAPARTAPASSAS